MQFATIFTIAFAAIVAAAPVEKRQASGHATYYSTAYPTYSSCGDQPHDTDFVAALAPSFMGASCGKKIRVINTATGGTVDVTVVDTCQACAGGSVAVDLTPTAFSQLASLDAGVFPASWTFI